MKKVVLSIDDQMMNLLLISDYLAETDFEVLSYQDAEAALNYVLSGQQVDAIVLDSEMPNIDGIEFVRRLHAAEVFKNIPIILITGASSADDVARGISAGVFYFLSKPFKQSTFLAILNRALKAFQVYKGLQTSIYTTAQSLSLMDKCQFTFRTLEEVKVISRFIAQLSPSPEAVILGLYELMLNAVEHGNLGISYQEKNEWIRQGIWKKEVSKRLAKPQYRKKKAKIQVAKDRKKIVFRLEDQGDGFDWEYFLDLHPNRANSKFGRGIAMSKKLCFDTLEYQDPGNVVIFSKFFIH